MLHFTGLYFRTSRFENITLTNFSKIKYKQSLSPPIIHPTSVSTSFLSFHPTAFHTLRLFSRCRVPPPDDTLLQFQKPFL